MSGNICRVCLYLIENGCSLFEVYENDLVLSEVLNKCLDMKIEEDDGVSSMVYDGCAEVIMKVVEDLVEITIVEKEAEEFMLDKYICDDLRDHMDSHCKELKYECGVCKKRLKSRTSLSKRPIKTAGAGA
ncbi:PREDICTED: uncharacterized protein LOC108564545 [Nicrophorus vespilloides]|uniref:Uncharacterized protein LOC108564545 n=1 Tax=Nicrophorus vespilloides TaxID=110193 RepID=A0ABM1MX06_NICVS|nr:PREDICTED: uncharacterized protein LOC108564545 [Nicrophorus vespilloides]